jgi:hypothetical protein
MKVAIVTDTAISQGLAFGFHWALIASAAAAVI